MQEDAGWVEMSLQGLGLQRQVQVLGRPLAAALCAWSRHGGSTAAYLSSSLRVQHLTFGTQGTGSIALQQTGAGPRGERERVFGIGSCQLVSHTGTVRARLTQPRWRRPEQRIEHTDEIGASLDHCPAVGDGRVELMGTLRVKHLLG